MTKYLVSGLAAALLCGVAAVPAAAVTTVINISNTNCADGSCSDGEALVQTLGDSALANVSHRSKTIAGVTFEPALKYWGSGYGDLVGVAWGGTNPFSYRGEWVITATAGYEVALIGFDAGCYQNRTSCQVLNFTVTNLSGNSLAGGALLTGYPGHVSTPTPLSNYVSGIILSWGADAYDVGLDNITFDVRAITAGPVPEPASWAMMLGGLAIVGSAMRRRKTAVAFA